MVDFGSVFGTLDLRKWESRKRGAHFQKFVFFMLGVTFSCFFDVLGCFGDSFWGAKVEPEWLRNSIQKWNDFWVAHSTVLGRQRGPHGSPRSPRGAGDGCAWEGIGG